jgi:hypothetical protein
MDFQYWSSMMDALKATVRSGQLELKAPIDWPDGTEVLIEPWIAPSEKISLDESEWSDDAASLADWEAWIKTIEPLEFSPKETRSMAEFNVQMRRLNIEAVRRQMQLGESE